VFMLSTWLLAC